MKESTLTPLFFDAIVYSADKHKLQRRKDHQKTPYINHPLQVMRILHNIGGVQDEEVLIAALLHDTIEDTETRWDDLAHEFSAKIANIVQEVTDNKALDKAERKRLQVEHAPNLSNGAKLVKLADKISNVQDVIINPPADWPVERRTEYLIWAKEVVDGLRGTNAGMEQLFDDLIAKANGALEA